MNELHQLIPGLREAEERDGSQWDAAWLGLNESICGIEVKPYTPRHDLILGWNGMRSPFLGGDWPERGTGIAEAALQFMWVVSPIFPNCTQLERMKFNRKVGKFLDSKNLFAEIALYVEGAFADAPTASKAGRRDFYSWFAGACDLFASEYGWTPQQLIDMPMKQIFQLAKSMRERKNPDCHLFSQSDRIIGEWLKHQNEAAENN